MKYDFRADNIRDLSAYCFMFFLALLPVFTEVGKVNNLFHASIILMAFFLLIKSKDKLDFLSDFDKDLFWGLILISVFLFYFSLSNLWSSNPENFFSSFKHTFYLLFFVSMVSYVVNNRSILTLHYLIFSGCFVLLILTFLLVDKNTLLTNRLERGFSLAPSNVIDLGGYFAIGIISCLIIIRETGKHWLYFAAILLFIGLLLTQSRGPLLALCVAMLLLVTKYKNVHLKHIIYLALSLLIIFLFMQLTGYGSEFYSRMTDSYKQSFIRFGIWENAFTLAKEHFWFGWGFDKQLEFTNSIGQNITTTHSVYFSTFLKGGVIGVLCLIALILWGLSQAYKRYHEAMALEAVLYIFSLLYFLTQGMFVLGSPGEAWMLFWLPLAVVAAKRKA